MDRVSVPLPHASPFRLCGRACWLANADGLPEHPCCAWWEQQAPGQGCGACRASDQAQRRGPLPQSSRQADWAPRPKIFGGSAGAAT